MRVSIPALAGLSILPCLVLGTVLEAAYPLPPAVTGDAYVASYVNDRVCVYSPVGEFLFDFAGGGLSGPRDIVVSGDEVFVASQNTNEVLVFDLNGNFAHAFSGPQLSGPSALASGPNDRLYVCAANSNRVYVFSGDHELVGLIEGGGLSWPNGVALDAEGNVFVSSVNTDDVRQYDADGQFVRAIGGGGLDHPTGLAFGSSGDLYVAGSGSNNVVRYDDAGEVVDVFVHADFASPQGIAVDGDGRFYVSQFFSDGILVFSPDFVYETTISGGTLDAPRGLAFRESTPSAVDPRPVASRIVGVHSAPEPFRESAEVRFTLQDATTVGLSIFDAQGRLLRRIDSRPLTAGPQSLTWDGNDRAGMPVGNGTYYYQLEAGDGRVSGTLTRIR